MNFDIARHIYYFILYIVEPQQIKYLSINCVAYTAICQFCNSINILLQGQDKISVNKLCSNMTIFVCDSMYIGTKYTNSTIGHMQWVKAPIYDYKDRNLCYCTMFHWSYICSQLSIRLFRLLYLGSCRSWLEYWY